MKTIRKLHRELKKQWSDLFPLIVGVWILIFASLINYAKLYDSFPVLAVVYYCVGIWVANLK